MWEYLVELFSKPAIMLTTLEQIILFIIRQDWDALPFAIFGLLFNVGSMLMEDK